MPGTLSHLRIYPPPQAPQLAALLASSNGVSPPSDLIERQVSQSPDPHSLPPSSHGLRVFRSQLSISHSAKCRAAKLLACANSLKIWENSSRKGKRLWINTWYSNCSLWGSKMALIPPSFRSFTKTTLGRSNSFNARTRSKLFTSYPHN